MTGAQRHAGIVAQLCRYIEGRDGVPTLDELAAHVGLSPSHTHRLFKAQTGLTPRAYAVGHRNEQMQLALCSSTTVTEAIYAAGFVSSGRFYEASNRALGMTPSTYANGGAREHIRFAVGASSLGAVLVAATATGVCCIQLGDEPVPLIEDLERRFPKATLVGADREFEAVVAKVVGMIEDPGAGHDLPLDLRGTVFQRRVWQVLAQIPSGTTRNYGEIARMLGDPGAARAVAGACAANPLAVAVPCHRVVRSDGSLSGYRWGVARKRTLLARERGNGA